MKLTIGWLYPDLMSTYSDRGNIICLTKRCLWRDFEVEIISIEKKTSLEKIKTINLFFGGGAQDRQQEMVTRDLLSEKGEVIKELIEDGIPGLFTCGSYQLLGRYYEPSEGKRINGLSIFDITTKHPGVNVSRCIGNVAAVALLEEVKGKILVGFENHGGRTSLGDKAKPLAKIIKGYGNNGQDNTEGAIYKNAIGTYLHGPVLPKNSCLADDLIKKALLKKYGKIDSLTKLDDEIENNARKAVLKKLHLGYNGEH